MVTQQQAGAGSATERFLSCVLEDEERERGDQERTLVCVSAGKALDLTGAGDDRLHPPATVRSPTFHGIAEHIWGDSASSGKGHQYLWGSWVSSNGETLTAAGASGRRSHAASRSGGKEEAFGNEISIKTRFRSR